jgi:hypothetical protein
MTHDFLVRSNARIGNGPIPYLFVWWINDEAL